MDPIGYIVLSGLISSSILGVYHILLMAQIRRTLRK